MNYPAEFNGQELDQEELNKGLFLLEAEAAVIQAITVDPERIPDVLEVLSVQDFYNKRNRDVFDHLVKYYDEHGGREPTEVIMALGEVDYDSFTYALDLHRQSIGTSANVLAYANVVKERAQLRRMKNSLEEVVQKIHETKDYESCLEYVGAKLIELEAKTETEEVESGNDVLKRVVQKLDHLFRNASNGELPGYRTGLFDLDNRYGGLIDSYLYIWAGRPSMGKSLAAMQVVQTVALEQLKENEVVVVFSLEMAKDQVYMRMLSTQGRIPYGRLSKGRLLEEDWVKLSSAVSILKDSKIIIIDTPGLTIRQVRNIVRKIHRKTKVRTIMADYLQLIEGEGENQTNRITNVSQNFKQMAKEINCPVIALAQLNRGVEQRPNKRPVNSDLRDSGSLEQDADVITFFYRDDYYYEDSPQKGIVELITKKWRDGETGTDLAVNKYDYMRIENMSKGYSEDDH